MNAIAIVLALTCAWAANAPLAVTDAILAEPCVYFDPTKFPPEWGFAPSCNLESESSNAT